MRAVKVCAHAYYKGGIMRKFLIFILTVSLGFALAACDKKKEAVDAVVLVEAVKAVKTDIAWSASYQATVASNSDVNVRAQVGGILKKKFFKEGDDVVKGQQLFLIDPEPYETDLKKAKGSLAQADADLKKTLRDYERMEKLYKENAVSQKDRDDSLSAYEKARANFEVLQGAVEDAKRRLAYTKVFSPASGITRNDKYSVGNLILEVGEASFLVNIVQIDPLEVHFSFTGGEWSALLKSLDSGRMDAGVVDVKIILSDGSLYPETGKIKFIDVVEDTKTGTISVKADVPNPGKKRTLLPGQFVTAVTEGLVYKDAVVVPQSAVLTTAKGSMVFTVGADGTAVLTPVKFYNYKNFTLVEGLEGGETVVSKGVIKVRPGAKVKTEMKEFDVSSIAPHAAAGGQPKQQ